METWARGGPKPLGRKRQNMNKPFLLLVDDSADMGAIVRLLGKRAGVQVEEYGCVADGWTALQQRPPELLLLDMRLSGESGADLCRRVRLSPELRPLKIALFTNLEMQDDIRQGLEAGADLLFAKNLVTQMDDWQARLKEILAWTRGRVWRKLVALKTSAAWPAPPPDWVRLYNQTLQQVLARHFGADMLRVLLYRAVQQTFVWKKRSEEPSAWLAGDGALLHESRIAAAADAETMAILGASLAEQVWSVLGSRDSATFAAALAPIVPGLKEAVLFQ